MIQTPSRAIALSGLVLSLLGLSIAVAENRTFRLMVSAGQFDRENVPVQTVIDLPDALRKHPVGATLVDQNGNQLDAQVTQLGLTAAQPNAGQRHLHFVLPKLDAGHTLQLTATVSGESSPAAKQFQWTDSVGTFAELGFDGRPILRYMYERLDESSPERRRETCKVYHHVYDPRGQRFVTKGPGGLFPHHRGLFYGFNRIRCTGGKTADIWHCRNGESQTHEGFINSEQGPILGRHVVAVDWHGQDSQVFAQEQREMTVYNIPGGTLIEFASKLTSTVAMLKLDGDPQHAGFQFRASQEVPEKTKAFTYYLRPDGKDEPGNFRNWPQDKDHVNLPWNAMSFVLGDQRYTCCYLDHPGNPKEARYSERDYGRFGSYFEYQLDEGDTLRLCYRIWLQEGEMTSQQVDRYSHDFVDPPIVRVKRL